MNETNKISCEVCRDLLPLVKDNVASSESVEAVNRHISNCPDCKQLCENDVFPELKISGAQSAFKRVKHRLMTFYTVLMFFAIYFGLSLTAGQELFFNCLIMPVVGVLGYVIFRRKSIIIIPPLLLVIHIAINYLGLLKTAEQLDMPSLVMWTVIYSLFALAGIIIAWLLHFAFGKER